MTEQEHDHDQFGWDLTTVRDGPNGQLRGDEDARLRKALDYPLIWLLPIYAKRWAWNDHDPRDG